MIFSVYNTQKLKYILLSAIEIDVNGSLFFSQIKRQKVCLIIMEALSFEPPLGAITNQWNVIAEASLTIFILPLLPCWMELSRMSIYPPKYDFKNHSLNDLLTWIHVKMLKHRRLEQPPGLIFLHGFHFECQRTSIVLISKFDTREFHCIK